MDRPPPRCLKTERPRGSGKKRASRNAPCHSSESERNANVSPIPAIAPWLRVTGSKEPVPWEPAVERLHLVHLF